MILKVLNCPIEHAGCESIVVKHFNVGMGGFEAKLNKMLNGRIAKQMASDKFSHAGDFFIFGAELFDINKVMVISLGDPPLGLQRLKDTSYDAIRLSSYISTKEFIKLGASRYATTMHGLTFGLDVQIASKKMIDGIVEAIKWAEKTNDEYLTLKEINIVERDSKRFDLIKNGIKTATSSHANRISQFGDDFFVTTRLQEIGDGKERLLSFVNIDIVNSSKIKKELQNNQSKLNIFDDFHILIDKLLETCKGKDFQRDGDGGIFYFENCDDAVKFSLLAFKNLNIINSNYKLHDKEKIFIRSGVHTGLSHIDFSKQTGRLSSYIIDVACHLQKQPIDGKQKHRLLISKDTYQQLDNSLQKYFFGPSPFEKDDIEIYSAYVG